MVSPHKALFNVLTGGNATGKTICFKLLHFFQNLPDLFSEILKIEIFSNGETIKDRKKTFFDSLNKNAQMLFDKAFPLFSDSLTRPAGSIIYSFKKGKNQKAIHITIELKKKGRGASNFNLKLDNKSLRAVATVIPLKGSKSKQENDKNLRIGLDFFRFLQVKEINSFYEFLSKDLFITKTSIFYLPAARDAIFEGVSHFGYFN